MTLKSECAERVCIISVYAIQYITESVELALLPIEGVAFAIV